MPENADKAAAGAELEDGERPGAQQGTEPGPDMGAPPEPYDPWAPPGQRRADSPPEDATVSLGKEREGISGGPSPTVPPQAAAPEGEQPTLIDVSPPDADAGAAPRAADDAPTAVMRSPEAPPPAVPGPLNPPPSASGSAAAPPPVPGPAVPGPAVAPPPAPGPGGAVPPPPIAPTGPGPSAYPPPYGAAPYGAPGPYPAPYGAAPGSYGAAHPGYPGYAGYPGAPAGYGPRWHPVPTGPNNGLGITALVLGTIGSVLFISSIFAVILGILAIVFGVVGRVKANRGEANNGGQALAGIILGAFAVLAGAAVFVLIVIAGQQAASEDWDEPNYEPYSAIVHNGR
ncbi:hypothetical protein AB0C51_21255 [Streptomyces pathocidini]|uniref:DUF4190 domain-containing protein n=1 Tax=Streptomyces pathocidini TaxID=1650571 RepID=UPI0033E1ED17